MKQINKYISKKLHINKDIGKHIEIKYNYHPKTRDELKKQQINLQKKMELKPI